VDPSEAATPVADQRKEIGAFSPRGEARPIATACAGIDAGFSIAFFP